ncbi:phage tail protein [Geodermatophilus sp. SYSU D00758]
MTKPPPDPGARGPDSLDPYPFDRDVLAEVADRLYAALPALYRVPDAPPAGRGDLLRLLQVLAAPLAVVRQSIDDLHADLFVDTADDAMIPYLAEMVGVRLAFPDAASNRRDVRGTVGWRRRKGTPAALEEMGSELTGQPIVLTEGWRRVQLAQDLDLPRPERVVVDVRPAVVAEQSGGPLDALHHTVDIRAISATTGRHHPRHVTHWLSPTVTFPLRGATAPDRSVPPDSDVRHAVHPLGVRQQLRASRAAGDRTPFVDRIPEQHFAAAPQRWFAATGGITVRVCGMPAAVAGIPAGVERVPETLVADAVLGAGNATLTALDLPTRGWRGPVRVELGLAAVTEQPEPGSWRPGAVDVRAGVDLDVAGATGSTASGGAAPAGERVPVLRLRPGGGAPGGFFPGADLEVASAAAAAATQARDDRLIVEGFLRGVLHVRVPPLELRAERLLLLAADGSLYDAATPDGTPRTMPGAAGARRLDRGALLAVGPGAAWPPAPLRSEPRMLSRVPAAPGRGPAVLHGARALRTDGGEAPLPADIACALVFAAQVRGSGGPAFAPFQRLSWTGHDPRGARWAAVGATGAPLDARGAMARYAELAADRAEDPDGVALAVRFECARADARLCPGEVAWSADDGRTVLVHLPQLDTDEPVPPGAAWPAGPGLGFASDAVRVAEDGSTWASRSTAVRRAALGDVAPIAEAAGLRRRRVRSRRLCAWDREDRTATPPMTLPFTPPGRLDLDVAHGLFAFAEQEPPQAWPASAHEPDAGVPPAVTTDHEEGATAHVGARPAAREPELGLRLPLPTRLVSAGGVLHPDAPAEWHTIPRYPTLTAALAAVSDRWRDLPVPADGTPVQDVQVVQFEDSATYPDEAPVWPAGPDDPALRNTARLELVVQAAERERPTVLVDPSAGWTLPPTPPRYAALTLRGVAVGGAGWSGATLPTADRVRLELCSVLHAENRLTFGDLPTGTDVTVTRCETAGLDLAGTGRLTVADSIVDAAGDTAVSAPAGLVELERVSVGGGVRARVLEATEVIVDGLVTVEDRFHGCVRYSRVGTGSTLPRMHRVRVGTAVRVVSRNRRDPAWWRLRDDCDPAVLRGAESGAEMGAFGLTRLAVRTAAFAQRLEEFTPAGLVSGIVRID